MLYHWSWTDEQLAAADQSTLGNVSAEIVRSSRKGYHLISIARSTSDWLVKNIDLSKSDKSQVGSLGKSYTQSGALHRRAAFHIEISTISHDYELVDNKARVSIGYLSRSRLLDPARLVVENIDNDGWLFDFLIRNSKKHAGVGFVSLELSHGGGRDVLRVLSQNIKDRRIACLITDSDKKFPEDAKSKTVTAAEKICSDSGSPFHFVKELPCHEIENIIPLDVVRLAQCATGNIGIPILQSIEAAESAALCSLDQRYWIFFDIKNGLNEKRISEMKPSEVVWHSGKLELAQLSVGQRELPGFGKNVVPQISGNGLLVSALISSIQKSDWKSIFLHAFVEASWIFAGDKATVT